MSVSPRDTRGQSRLVWVLLLLQIDRHTAGHHNKQTSSVCQPQSILCIATSRRVVRRYYILSFTWSTDIHLTSVLIGLPFTLRPHLAGPLLRSLRMEALFLTSDQTAPIFLRFRKRYAEEVSYLACLLVSYNNAMNILMKFAIELVYIKT